MPNIQEKYRLTPPQEQRVTGVDPYPMNIPSDALVGIEVEVENTGNMGSLPRGSVWRVESDGSLRNNGLEFITAPIRASEAPMALSQLLSKVLTDDCHFSPRTSVHIHLNVQDMEVAQVLDLVLLYAVYERLFYKFAGRGRIRNIFCVPITETSVMTGMMEQAIGTNWSKYTGLNLVPVRGGRDEGSAYGTIEFRQMHGTFNVDKLCMWIDLITTLKTYVMKTSTKDIRTMVGSMDEFFDYGRQLELIFGDKASWLKYDGFDEVKDTHLVAKSTLLSSKTKNRVANAMHPDAPFYKFKG